MEMILDFGRTRQEQWARGAGMALCLLVLVFSFAAKLSWYQPKSLGMPVKTLSSSKMWQHEAKVAAAMMSSPEDSGLAAAQMVAIVSAVLLLTVAVRWGLAPLAAGDWLERDIAVSLQQTEFSRISQLRAPPVR
jgi:hypothetical protein